jgi:hypothetical protein
MYGMGKKVSFCEFVRVLEIPGNSEFRDIKKYLWWSSFDFKNFRSSAIDEIKIFTLYYSGMTSSQAKKILYQDQNEFNY